jgi:vacuolar-type H+-ATPase subunit I/STV1
MYYPYQHYSQIEQRLQQMEEEVKKLKAENNELGEKLDNIKPINIENINYKIQELVVRELKGTLNIGMTGITDPKEISKWLNQDEEEQADEAEIHFNNMSQDNEGMEEQ